MRVARAGRLVDVTVNVTVNIVVIRYVVTLCACVLFLLFS